MALPTNSLLDIYDKQQEQCNSIALLPLNTNGSVIRRHSSHCYPLFEDKSQEQTFSSQTLKLHHAPTYQTQNSQHKQLQQLLVENISITVPVPIAAVDDVSLLILKDILFE